MVSKRSATPSALPQYSDDDRTRIKAIVVANITKGLYLHKFCGKDGIPDAKTIWTWRAADKEFSAAVNAAREDSGEIHELRVKEISDGTLAGKYAPDAARVAISAETWLAKVRAPKVYGDRAEVAVTGNITINFPPSDAGVL